MQKVTLFRQHQTSKIGLWTIELDTNGTLVMRSFSSEGASPVVHYEQVVPKANRTLDEQIELRMRSRINDKLDAGYFHTKEEAVANANNNAMLYFKPMLASSSWQKLLARADSVFVQPKLDGMRIVLFRDDDRVVGYTRKGKELQTIDHILSSAKSILNPGEYMDGELYIHNLSLQSIISLAKREQSDSSLLEFHAFDMIIPDTTFKHRFSELQTRVTNAEHIKLVNTQKLEGDVTQLLSDYRELGYEGLILRDGNKEYEPGKRSQHIAKVKHFVDQEFSCLGVTTGDKGRAVLVCLTTSGKEFRVTAPGTREEQARALEEPQRFAHKMVTIKHAGFTPYGIPFHPVCLGVKELS